MSYDEESYFLCSQVWVGAMSQGPTGKPLHAVYKTMETLEFQDELGKTVLQVCQVCKCSDV